MLFPHTHTHTGSSVYDFHVEAMHSFLFTADEVHPPIPPAEWLATLHTLSKEMPAPPSYARNQLAARILSISLPNNGIRIGPVELFQFICRNASRYGLRTLDVRPLSSSFQQLSS